MKILRAISKHPSRDEFENDFLASPCDVVDIGNVAKYYFSIDKKDGKVFLLEDLPTVLPKSDRVFMYYTVDDRERFVPFYGLVDIPESEMTHRVMTGSSKETLSVAAGIVVSHDTDFLRENGIYTMRKPDRILLCRLYATSMYGKKETVEFTNLVIGVALDSDGAICILDTRYTELKPRDSEMLNRLGQKPKTIVVFGRALDSIPEDKRPYVERVGVGILTPFLLACTFMQSRNTILVDHETAFRIGKGRARKLDRRRLPKKRITPKVIAIKPLKSNVRVKPGVLSDGDRDGPHRNNSRLKAHFRTYTKDGGGLFGKYYGTFLVTGFGYDSHQGEYMIDLS